MHQRLAPVDAVRSKTNQSSTFAAICKRLLNTAKQVLYSFPHLLPPTIDVAWRLVGALARLDFLLQGRESSVWQCLTLLRAPGDGLLLFSLGVLIIVCLLLWNHRDVVSRSSAPLQNACHKGRRRRCNCKNRQRLVKSSMRTCSRKTLRRQRSRFNKRPPNSR